MAYRWLIVAALAAGSLVSQFVPGTTLSFPGGMYASIDTTTTPPSLVLIVAGGDPVFVQIQPVPVYHERVRVTVHRFAALDQRPCIAQQSYPVPVWLLPEAGLWPSIAEIPRTGLAIVPTTARTYGAPTYTDPVRWDFVTSYTNGYTVSPCTPLRAPELVAVWLSWERY